MQYVLMKVSTYTDGSKAVAYFKSIMPIIPMVECTLHKEDAKVFQTKKEASAMAKQLGKKWDVIKI